MKGETIMSKIAYWSVDSWGNGYPPINANVIIDVANSQIDEWIEKNPDYYESELKDFVDMQWETFCSTGRIGGVEAIYEDEE